MCWFCVWVLPLVWHEYAVWGPKVIRFLSPVDEVGFDENGAPVMYNTLKKSGRMNPILDNGDCNVITSITYWVYHQEATKCINY